MFAPSIRGQVADGKIWVEPRQLPLKPQRDSSRPGIEVGDPDRARALNEAIAERLANCLFGAPQAVDPLHRESVWNLLQEAPLVLTECYLDEPVRQVRA